MFGLQTLDVIIGLIVIYLLLGLVCTAVNEWLSSMFSMKAKTLWAAIQNMIARDEKSSSFWLFKTLHVNFKRDADGTVKNGTTVHQFYTNPLVESLSEKGKLPSYITADTFRKVLLDMNGVYAPAKEKFEVLKASVEAIQDPRLNAILTGFAQDAELAEDQVAAFHQQVENWFDECMERASGWYRRSIQFITFCFAAGMVIAFNVDSVDITRQLWTNAPLREQFAKLGDQLAKEENVNDVAKVAKLDLKKGSVQIYPDSAGAKILTDTINTSRLKGKYNELKKEIGLPLGWSSVNFQTAFVDQPFQGKFLFLLAKCLGLFMSIAAASMGAPFWFNMLKSVTSLRKGA